MVVSGSNILKAHADYLRDFWAKYRNGDNKRWVSKAEWCEVIAALQRAGEFVIVYTKPKLNDYTIRRKEFDKVKDIRHRYKFKPKDQCLACGERPNVRHHIIWLKNGGRNNRRNICFLCNSCHAQVHPWLQS